MQVSFGDDGCDVRVGQNVAGWPLMGGLYMRAVAIYAMSLIEWARTTRPVLPTRAADVMVIISSAPCSGQLDGEDELLVSREPRVNFVAYCRGMGEMLVTDAPSWW